VSGTLTTPIFGSIVQNGKLALCAFALDKQLNKVDFPTFGNPTIPAFINLIISVANIIVFITKKSRKIGIWYDLFLV
jgi:hypothetical protein